MKKKQFIVIGTSLLIAALFVFGGCSSDLSTSPNTSSALDQKIAASTSNKDVLVGFKGERPYSALEAAGATIICTDVVRTAVQIAAELILEKENAVDR